MSSRQKSLPGFDGSAFVGVTVVVNISLAVDKSSEM